MIPKPVPMSTTNLATGATTYHLAAMDRAQIWRSAVAIAATRARQQLPASNTRIDKAIELILNNHVDFVDGVASVRSQSGDKETIYEIRNGHCECADYERAPESWCKHRLARAVYIRAMEEAKKFALHTEPTITVSPQEVGDMATAEPPEEPPAPPEPPAIVEAGPLEEDPTPDIPREFLVSLWGKWFVLYIGLLNLGTQRGLVSLTEVVTHVSDSLVMATATATFADGRVFTGFGDATPDNVGAKVKLHWRRMAGTRAKARALRDALNIGICSFEELD